MADATLTPLPRSADKYSDSSMLHTVALSYSDCKHQATNKNSKMLRMRTTAQIRYENLVKLLNELGEGDLTRMLEKSRSWKMVKSPNRLSRPNLDQIIKKRKTSKGSIRGVGHDLARQIETEFKLVEGWMDIPHDIAINEQAQSVPLPSKEEIGEIVLLFMRMPPESREMILMAAKEAVDEGLLQMERGAV